MLVEAGFGICALVSADLLISVSSSDTALTLLSLWHDLFDTAGELVLLCHQVTVVRYVDNDRADRILIGHIPRLIHSGHFWSI
jgi:hypothetical protein